MEHSNTTNISTCNILINLFTSLECIKKTNFLQVVQMVQEWDMPSMQIKKTPQHVVRLLRSTRHMLRRVERFMEEKNMERAMAEPLS